MLPGRIHLSIRRRFGSEVVVVKVLPAASKAGMLSSLWVQVRLGLFHLPLHCLRWEIGEARHCYLKEDAGDGVSDLGQSELQHRQVHLLCQS